MGTYEDMLLRQQMAEQAMKTNPTVSDAALRGGVMGGVEALKSMPRTSDKKPMTSEQDARRAEMLRKLEEKAPTTKTEMGRKKGGKVCGMKKGGAVKARGCGIAERGLTKGKMR